MPRATQGTLGLAGVPAKSVLYGGKPPSTKVCGGCKQKVIQFALQGTQVVDQLTGPRGRIIKCDPEPKDDGEFFLVGKVFHRRRPEDERGWFYREHRCPSW